MRILPHLLYLRPRENSLLQVSQFALNFVPEAKVDWMRDDFDNLPASARFFLDSSSLEIRSDCVVATADLPPFDFLVRDYALNFPFNYEPLHRFNLSIYLTPPEDWVQASVRQWLESRFIFRPLETVAWIFALNQTIFQNLRYVRRDEPGIQMPLRTISHGSGSCRDYAVLLIACARTLGLAARFVSGYLFDPAINGNDRGDMHAWVEVFLPGAGWRGIDPTHGIFCDNAYVPVAHAVVAESVNPIQGSYTSPFSVSTHLSVDVRLTRTDGLPVGAPMPVR